MKKMPLVTIVTLTYKKFNDLKKCIHSVLIQNYPNIEYIISDDGSENFPYEEIKKYIEENKREKDRIEMEENQNIEVQENSYYSKSRENYAVMEEKRYGPIKKFAKRFKSGKWGEWDDLITEADDYE